MAACHRALGEVLAAEDMRAKLFLEKPDFDVERFAATLPHRSAATADRSRRELDWLCPDGG